MSIMQLIHVMFICLTYLVCIILISISCNYRLDYILNTQCLNIPVHVVTFQLNHVLCLNCHVIMMMAAPHVM